MKTLWILTALSLPAVAQGVPKHVNGLQWSIQMEREFSNFGAIDIRATLYNVSGRSMIYRSAGKRPPLALILTPAGGKPVKRPLPAKAFADRTPGTLRPMAPAWIVMADLRQAFGALPPGRYTFQLVHEAKGYDVNLPGFKPAAITAEPLKFEVIKTSLVEAHKANRKAAGIDLKIKAKAKTKVAVLVNRRNRPLVFWAYGEDKGQPLNAILAPQSWTGRTWTGGLQPHCGTGLVRIRLLPGQSRELRLPAYRDGLVRFLFSCQEEGAPKKQIQVVSDVILAKP